MIPGILITIDGLKTTPPNAGSLRVMSPGARMGYVKKARDQVERVRLEVRAALARRQLKATDLEPILVTLTRVSAGQTDDDGNIGALKHVQDGVARELGIDDGDTARLRFAYRQERGDRGHYAVTILIEQDARGGGANVLENIRRIAGAVRVVRDELRVVSPLFRELTKVAIRLVDLANGEHPVERKGDF